jgi:opine dehydrogenase
LIEEGIEAVKDKFAVIGAGAGGLAVAGHLASCGKDVTLYNRSKDRIEVFKTRDHIDIDGMENVPRKLSYIGRDICEAIHDRDVIMVVITADGHREITAKMAPCLKDGQIILLIPGRTFGALEVENTLKQSGCTANVIVAEANTLFYAVRATAPGRVRIKGVKKIVTISALHAVDTEYVIDKIQDSYPQVTAADSFLETSFGNIGAIFHPAIMLLNKDRISRKESFLFYAVSRRVADFVEKIDHEVKNVVKALGADVPSVKVWLASRYDLKSTDIYSMMRSNPTYKGIMAPTTFDHRYLWEDIPTGLVPISLFGKIVGVDTESLDQMIDEGSDLLNRNFREEGRTPEKLGLSADNLLSDIENIIRKQSS